MRISEEVYFCHPVDWLGKLLCLNLATRSENHFVLSLKKLVYCTAMFIVFSVNFLYSIVWLTIIKSGKPNLNAVAVMVVITLQALPPIASLYLSLVRRRILVDQLNKIDSVFKQLIKLGFENKYMQSLSSIMIYSNVIVLLLTICGDIYLNMNEPPPESLTQKLLSSVTYYISKLGYVWAETHFTLYVYVLNNILIHIKSSMIIRLQQSESTYKRKSTIKAFSSMFMSIIKISKEINTDFSVQFLIGCVCFIFHTAFLLKIALIDIYHNFSGNEVHVFRPVICVGFTVYGVMLLFAVAHICELTTTEVKSMAAAIHDLVATEKVDDVSNELFDFSLLILHMDFQLTACDFFPIDFALIQRVASSITSYLIYLMQFQFSSREHI